MPKDESKKNPELAKPASSLEVQETAQEVESTAEQPEAHVEVEQRVETSVEQESSGEVQEEGEVQEDAPTEAVQGTTQVVVDQPVAQQKDRLEQEIESIMEEDLTEMFLSMPPDKQKEFKEKGEETLGKIRELVNATKINAKKIFQLLRNWMKLIPGVNRFFLEQEAKLKTDKIIFISEEEKKRGLDEV